MTDTDDTLASGPAAEDSGDTLETIEHPADEALEAADEDVSDEADVGDEEAEETGEPEFVTIEHDGQSYEVPKALEKGFLMQKDYTKKTMSLAEQSKKAEAAESAALETKKQLDEAMQADTEIRELDFHLWAIDQALEQYAGPLDWEALKEAGQDTAVVFEQNRLRTERDKIAAQKQQKISEHNGKLQQTLAKQLETAKAEIAKIPGMSEQRMQDIKDYAVSRGAVAQEVDSILASNPVMVRVLEEALFGHRVRENRRKQKSASPAPKPEPTRVARSRGAATRGPTDNMSTSEWMARRNKDLARERTR